MINYHIRKLIPFFFYLFNNILMKQTNNLMLFFPCRIYVCFTVDLFECEHLFCVSNHHYLFKYWIPFLIIYSLMKNNSFSLLSFYSSSVLIVKQLKFQKKINFFLYYPTFYQVDFFYSLISILALLVIYRFVYI